MLKTVKIGNGVPVLGEPRSFFFMFRTYKKLSNAQPRDAP